MRAFISYSLNDTEEFVLTILAKRLAEQGFTVSSSYNLYSNVVDFSTYSQLNKSNFFIGIITQEGNSKERVFNEWRVASEKRIPALLLIEDNVQITQQLANHPNIVRFNKTHPQPAIDFVRQKINSTTQVTVPLSNPTNNNTVAWMIGGLAVLALIGLLATDD